MSAPSDNGAEIIQREVRVTYRLCTVRVFMDRIGLIIITKTSTGPERTDKIQKMKKNEA